MINNKLNTAIASLLTCTMLSSFSIMVSAKESKNMYVNDIVGLNVRSSNSKESKKLGALPFNKEVSVVSKHGDWSLIEYQDSKNGTAYVCNEYLSDEKTHVEYIDKTSNATYLGTFTASYYCACSTCCGHSTGITSSGTIATAGRTVGVDTSVVPLGTHLLIDGVEYVAEDTGSGVDGNWVDIFCSSHQEALNLGLRSVEVYLLD